MYAPGDSGDKMALAIKEFNEFVIKDERVEVIALPFRDGVNIVQRRYCNCCLCAAQERFCCTSITFVALLTRVSVGKQCCVMLVRVCIGT